MSEFEIDLDNITQDTLQGAIVGYNSAYSSTFQLQQSSGAFALVNGDETYATGELRELAFYWEGFIAGQLQGLPEQDLDDGV